MREILFRGKRYMDGEWVDGSLFIDEKKEKHEILVGYVNYRYGWEVDPATVGQYTGQDKNGKKIFEGDYWIDEEGDILVVEYRKCQFCFVAYGYDDELFGFGEVGELDCVPLDYYYLNQIEIVGNIHDNPELLKGEEK